MPFANFDDWDDCIQTMTDEEGHDMDSAENICGALQAESKSEHGDPAELMDALQRGAGLIADVGVDLVSGVDVPAVDSKWVMTKNADGHDWRAQSPILLSKADDEDQRISYAAAMIPRETDKEGDVVATPTVEKAAHDFLKQNGGVDTDHSLIDGEGEVVESWVLKQERMFDLPGGETETYGAGTWMVGIEWGKDAWDRIQSGELTGLSIYGMAEHVQLDKSADCGCTSKQPEDDPCWDGYEMVGTKTDEFGNEVPNCVPVEEASAKRDAVKQLDIPLANESVVHLVYESRTAAEKASQEIGLDGAVHEHEFDGMTVFMPGETHDEFVERYMELSEENSEDVEQSLSDTKRQNGDTHKGADSETDGMAPEQTGDGGGDGSGDGETTDGGPDIGEVAASVESLAETVESVKDAVETNKADDQEAAAMLAEQRDNMAPGDILDIIDAASGREVGEVLDAIDAISASADEEDKESDMDDDEDDEDEIEASAEKRAEDANLSKGSDSRQTAAKTVTGDNSGGDLSYAELAEQEEA